MKRVPISPPRSPRVPQSVRVADGIQTDSLQNLVTGLGTSQDKATGTRYVFIEMGKEQLEAAFRSDWIARKAISIPAQDATREWRTWDVDKVDNKKIVQAEKDLGIQKKVKEAMIKARLYGGAALLMGVNNGEMEKELIPEKVGKGQLEFVHVVSKWELSAGELEWDLGSPLYSHPKYYMRAGGDGARIHPSRVIRFLGNEVPEVRLSNGWGDSILQAVNDAVVAAGMTLANGAQLLNEIKMDVIKIPSLTQALANKKYANLLSNRFALANQTKSLFNILLLDKNEDWERITTNMQAVPDTLKMYLLAASAAVDIPTTRFLGQSPQGLSATGESDMRNWYDHVKSEQVTTQQPALRPLDEILVRSTLGTVKPGDGEEDDEVEYHWNPLWQMDEAQRSTIIGQKATAFQVDVTAGLIPSEVLRDGRINQLIEDGVYPGLEQILEDYGPLDPIDDNPEPGSVIGPDGQPISPTDPAHPDNQPVKLGPDGKPLPADPTKPKPKTPLGDMAKRIRRANMRNGKYRHMDGVLRTLYVYRPVLNTGDLLSWAKEAGVPNLVASNELHTTIMYSRTPVDWSKTGEDWGGSDEKGNMTVKPGGMRALQKFGNAIVLCFNSSNLGWRHCQIKESTGATWDYAEYQPHVTLAYLDPEDHPPFDVEGLGAYQGKIEFGPEVFADASNPYVQDSNGNPYWGDYNENHDPDNGQFSEGSGGGSSGGGGSIPATPKERSAEFRTVSKGKNDKLNAAIVADIPGLKLEHGGDVKLRDLNEAIAHVAADSKEMAGLLANSTIATKPLKGLHGMQKGKTIYINSNAFKEHGVGFGASAIRHELEHKRLELQGVPNSQQEARVQHTAGTWAAVRYSSIAVTNPAAASGFKIAAREQGIKIKDGLFGDYNENHDPDNGQFSEGSGGSGSGGAAKGGGGGSKVERVKTTVKELLTKRGAQDAIKKAANKVGKNKAALANAGIQASLYHVAGIDYGPDIEKLIAHEIEHFAHNAGVGYSMAKSVFKEAAHGVRDWYTNMKVLATGKDGVIVDADELDPDIVQALEDLIKAIDAYEPPEDEE